MTAPETINNKHSSICCLISGQVKLLAAEARIEISDIYSCIFSLQQVLGASCFIFNGQLDRVKSFCFYNLNWVVKSPFLEIPYCQNLYLP